MRCASVLSHEVTLWSIDPRHSGSSHRDERACADAPGESTLAQPTDVMLVRVAGELAEIQRAWAAFESVVGLHGRKLYGAFDPVTATYSACAVLHPGDDPAVFGAERGTLPGGRYACVRLHGEPPAAYEQIGPTARRLAQRPDADRTRPTLEYYHGRGVIDVLGPIV